MANRTARYQKPGQHNLRGKLTKSACPCCDDIVNKTQESLDRIHADEIAEAEEWSKLEYDETANEWGHELDEEA